MKIFIMLIVVVACFVACDSGGSGNNIIDVNQKEMGEAGGECFPNGTCFEGLVCVDGTCMPKDKSEGPDSEEVEDPDSPDSGVVEDPDDVEKPDSGVVEDPDDVEEPDSGEVENPDDVEQPDDIEAPDDNDFDPDAIHSLPEHPALMAEAPCYIDTKGDIYCEEDWSTPLGYGDLRGKAYKVVRSGRPTELNTCSINLRGRIWCWGTYDIRADKFDEVPRSKPDEPYEITGDYVAVDFTVIHGSACIVTVEGDTLCWGRNISGELGDPDFINDRSKNFIKADIPAARSIGGHRYSGFTQFCARTLSNDVWCWGHTLRIPVHATSGWTMHSGTRGLVPPNTIERVVVNTYANPTHFVVSSITADPKLGTVEALASGFYGQGHIQYGEVHKLEGEFVSIGGRYYIEKMDDGVYELYKYNIDLGIFVFVQEIPH